MNKEELNIIDLEDGNTDASPSPDCPSDKKSKFKPLYIGGIVIALIIIVVLIKLIRWNAKSSAGIVPDVAAENELENLDYFVYPNEAQKELRNSDGVERILLIGNNYSTSSVNNKSILSILNEKVDAQIIPLIAESSILTALGGESILGDRDAFNLYQVTKALCTKEFSELYYWKESSIFSSIADAESYLNLLSSLDMDKIDSVIIMYDLRDYYNCISVIDPGNPDSLFGYYGCLKTAICMLQDTYPHLKIFVSSPTPGYMVDSDGTVLPSTQTDFGKGNSSYYADVAYTVALEQFVSYIDNYYYEISQDNVTSYLKDFKLTELGIETIGNHIADFLNQR